MVRIDEITFGLILLGTSFLLANNRDSYTLEKTPITQQFYEARKERNFEAIQNITNVQDKLQNIRSQTLQQEKFKTEKQIDILQSLKDEQGVLLSQLQKIEQIGQRMQGYSPRIRGITIRKKGYDPVNPDAIEAGKKASEQIKTVFSNISKIDLGILSLQKRFQNLKSI